MKTLKSCHITAMISDMDRAISFYTDTLGLPLKQRYGDHYAEIQCPNMTIGLHPSSDKLVKGNNLSIGLGVTNFDETVESMQAKDISLHIADEGWSRIASFQDPDGNALFVIEMKENF